MDLTTFDVTDHPTVRPGAWLEVIGPACTPDDVAAAAGTNGYEVLTSLGRRLHRVYRAQVDGAQVDGAQADGARVDDTQVCGAQVRSAG